MLFSENKSVDNTVIDIPFTFSQSQSYSILPDILATNSDQFSFCDTHHIDSTTNKLLATDTFKEEIHEPITKKDLYTHLIVMLMTGITNPDRAQFAWRG